MVETVGEDSKVAKEISCRGCGARLRYFENEVQEVYGKDYSGGADGHKFINCSRCSKKVIIKSW